MGNVSLPSSCSGGSGTGTGNNTLTQSPLPVLGIGTLQAAFFLCLEEDFTVLSGELGFFKWFRICFKFFICENRDIFLLVIFYVADCVVFMFSLYPRFCQVSF